VTHRSAAQLRRSGVYIARLGAAAPARNHRHTHADGWLAHLPSRRVTPHTHGDYVRVKLIIMLQNLTPLHKIKAATGEAMDKCTLVSIPKFKFPILFNDMDT
jgi:hypothetical protein